MSTPNEENLLSKNASYSSQFNQGGLTAPPANKLAIVTCMDARIDPAAAFGIDLGGAHIIRNAGGSAKDALRSLIISEQMLGTQEIHIIKHTNCGMQTFQNVDARVKIQQNLGLAAGQEAGSIDFLPFFDLTLTIKDDISYLKAQKTIPKDVTISGWIYEVETGKVNKVA